MIEKRAQRSFKKFYCDQKDVFLLPPTAFKVWMYHYSREGAERKSWPSRETTCRDLNIGMKALKAARKWLIENGWLKLVGQRDLTSGEFTVPVFQVDEGTVPRTQKDTTDGGPKRIPRSRGQKDTTVAVSKRYHEVDSVFEVDSIREVDIKTPALSSKSRPNGQDKAPDYRTKFFVWLADTYDGLNLTPKQKRLLLPTLEGDFTLPTLKRAVARCLDGKDPKNSFDRCPECLEKMVLA
jgi:hypothetical protein